MLVHNWEFVKIEILRWVIEAANFKLMSLTENPGNVFIVVWYQVHVNPICMRCMDTDYGWDFRPKFRLRWKASRFVISSFLNGISYYDTEASGIVLSLRPSICLSFCLSVWRRYSSQKNKLHIIAEVHRQGISVKRVDFFIVDTENGSH